MEESKSPPKDGAGLDAEGDLDLDGGAGDGAGVVADGDSGMLALEAPWVEKYRPRLLEDVVGNQEAVERLGVIASQGNMPNLILSGPPGTGKTTSVAALAHALLGAAVKDGLRELNASDDRGIEVVRTSIKNFAKLKVTLPPGRHKIIILDEADSMTKGAQQALRRTMELYSSTTRFALACNNSSKIIEPIQSRCAIIRFSKLSDKEVLSRVLTVCDAEKVPRTDDGLEAIVFTADGDMRGALNNLQSTFAGTGNVTKENVFKVCDQPHPDVVRVALMNLSNGDLDGGLKLMKRLWAQGYAGVDIVGTLFRVAKGLAIPERLKLCFIREIGFLHMRLTEGVSTLVQIEGLLGKCYQQWEACGRPGAAA